uniref:Uncharacterized protein n=1 Tax=Physcomitrium patens TaxID=3218 RepID=A0A2K1KWP0_PHYPA|nr:hypothetical protein PHYPA_005184 [Physcomitrium patens]
MFLLIEPRQAMCTYAQSFTTWVCSCGVLIVGVQLSARMLKYSINGVQASVPASSVDIEGSSFFWCRDLYHCKFFDHLVFL